MDINNIISWKYDLQKLDCTSAEFKFVEHFFKTTSTKFSLYPEILKNFQIWKVINTKETVDEKGNNLMLFHGTSREGVAGILVNGFKNSEKGFFGKGVYLTESSEAASFYSCLSFMKSDFLNFLFSKSFSFIFVNEVLKSETLQSVLYEDYSELYMVDTPLKTPFSKYMHVLSPQLTEENYKEDVNGRRYRDIAVDPVILEDEFVADSKLVIPRYLITYEGNIISNFISLLYFETLNFFRP